MEGRPEKKAKLQARRDRIGSDRDAKLKKAAAEYSPSLSMNAALGLALGEHEVWQVEPQIPAVVKRWALVVLL